MRRRSWKSNLAYWLNFGITKETEETVLSLLKLMGTRGVVLDVQSTPLARCPVDRLTEREAWELIDAAKWALQRQLIGVVR